MKSRDQNRDEGARRRTATANERKNNRQEQPAGEKKSVAFALLWNRRCRELSPRN